MFSMLGKRSSTVLGLAYTRTLKYARTSPGYRRTVLARRRAAARYGLSRGPVGTARRYVARVVREMPLYAPLPVSRNEMKYVDTDVSVGCDTTGSVTHLTLVSPGASCNAQREGSRIMLCGAQVRGKVAGGPVGFFARATLLLVYDRQSNGAAPAVTDVLETASSDSFQNTTNRSRFDILARWDWDLIGNSNAVVAPSTDKCVQSVDKKVVFNRVTVFDETTGTSTLANIRKGALFLITVGDVVAGNSAALFRGQVRVMYGDN